MNDSIQRKLAKDTVIYGLSSIVGKFLNWLLVPLYTFVLAQQADYGIVTNLYAWTALLLVLLTYGMETGFFRFANKENSDGATVYKTTLLSLFSTSFAFAALCVVFRERLADALGYANHAEFIAMLGVVVSMDAFAAIPFAYLRYQNKALKFALLKLLYVALNIFFNIFFLVICPRVSFFSEMPFYDPDYGVGYVFVANILSTSIQTLFLLPALADARKGRFDSNLLKKMLSYSFPLLILGICGIMNQTLDRIIFPFLYLQDDAQAQLGIYGACFKVAMVMMMFTQAFRYAYEPMVFAKYKDKKSIDSYADSMKYYVIFSLLILLGMTVYLDILKYIISPNYWSGMKIVPIVLWTYIFQGVFFNLSFWYKLTDNTRWGAYLSFISLIINVLLQIIFVPKYSYVASATAAGASYFVVMLVSYFVGRRYLDIPYDWRRMGLYVALCAFLLIVFYALTHFCSLAPWQKICLGTILVVIYLCVMIRKDFPLESLPYIGKFLKNR